jgi:hypothetical protein
MTERTRNRLARVLDEAGLLDMAQEAARGRYDDYDSESATPCVDLVNHLRERGREDLAKRAMSGEWDATIEESGAWAQRQTGQVGDLLDRLGLRDDNKDDETIEQQGDEE